MKKLLIGLLVVCTSAVPYMVAVDAPTEPETEADGSFLSTVGGIVGGIGDGSGPPDLSFEDITIDQVVGDVTAEVGDIVVADLISVENTSIDQNCAGSCSIAIGTGALNAVGDMYEWSVAGMNPVEFGNITQKIYILNPFQYGRAMYFTYTDTVNGVDMEGVFVAMSYERTMPGAPAILNRDIERTMKEHPEIKSSVKVLTKQKGTRLWAEVIDMQFSDKINKLIQNNSVAVFGIHADGTPFVILPKVLNNGREVSGIKFTAAPQTIIKMPTIRRAR